MDVEKAIREYLPNIIHLSLATSTDDQPWVCSLHYVYDDDLNFYFRSLESRRHSQDIIANPKVAGSIVTQHVIGQKLRGIFFDGTAKLLTDVGDTDPAYTLYCARFNTDAAIVEEAKTVEGHKFYMISVDNFYLLDGIESTPAQKHHLPWGKQGL